MFYDIIDVCRFKVLSTKLLNNSLMLAGLILSVDASGQSNKVKLSQLMTADMIGVQIAYIENIVGPAKRISGSSREYQIGGCTVNIIADEKDNSISSIELTNINKNCDFDSSNIFLNGRASTLLFKNVISLRGNNWFAYYSCFEACGNAANPTYGAFVDAPRVQQFMNYSFKVEWNKSSSQAADKLHKSLKMKYTKVQNWIGGYPDHFISKSVYSGLWYEAFKDVRISSLKFGYKILNDKTDNLQRDDFQMQ